MAITLYDAAVAPFIQTLTGLAGFLDRGLSHCQDNAIDPQEIVETRLFPDMLPFWFQVASASHHSLGAVEGVREGLFSPPGAPSERFTYASLQKLTADSIAALKALDPAEVNGWEGKDVGFKFGERTMPFTAEGFLLSFSKPNMYFHATTAYDILRTKGVPLGKRDFMGPLKLKM
jgi:hypothetical protein